MIDINPSLPEQQQASEKPLNLSDFAQRNQITEDRVWELIEEGELAARFVNDEILILREQNGEVDASEPSVDPVAEPSIYVNEEPLQALPGIATKAPSIESRAVVEEDFLAFDEEMDEPSERLNPSDDARDLLIFAQDAMNRTMDLSRQLLATKDELIRLKDEKIVQQQGELGRQEQEIRRMKRKLEDLETLCRMNPTI